MYWYDNFLSRVLKFELCDRELEMMTIRSRSPIPIHNPHYRLLLHQHHDKLLSCFSVMFPFLFFFFTIYHMYFVLCTQHPFFFLKDVVKDFFSHTHSIHIAREVFYFTRSLILLLCLLVLSSSTLMIKNGFQHKI